MRYRFTQKDCMQAVAAFNLYLKLNWHDELAIYKSDGEINEDVMKLKWR